MKCEFYAGVVTHAVMEQFTVDLVIAVSVFENGFIGTHFQIIIGFSNIQFENGTTLFPIEQLSIHILPQLDAVGSCGVALGDELLGQRGSECGCRHEEQLRVLSWRHGRVEGVDGCCWIEDNHGVIKGIGTGCKFCQ